MTGMHNDILYILIYIHFFTYLIYQKRISPLYPLKLKNMVILKYIYTTIYNYNIYYYLKSLKTQFNKTILKNNEP